MKNQPQQPMYTKGEWKQSGHVMPSEKLEVHKEKAFCQFIDTKFAHTKPALAFGSTKEEAEANAQRIVKAVNMHDGLIDGLKALKIYINASSKDNPNSASSALGLIDTLLKKAEQK